MPSTGWSQALNLKNLEPVAAISTIPNIVGDFIAFSSGTGSFYETSENKGNTMPSTSLDTPRHNRLRFDASRSSALYKNDLAEIRVNALFGLNLIKAF